MTTDDEIITQLRERAQAPSIGGMTVGEALRSLADLTEERRRTDAEIDAIADDARRLRAYLDRFEEKPQAPTESIAARAHRLMLEKDKQIAGLQAANASLATEAGLWAAEPTDEAASFARKVALIDAVRAIQADEATDEALAGENETVSQTAARLLRVAHERGAFAPLPPAPSFTNNGTRVTFFADGEDSPCSELTLCLGEMIEADPEEGIEAGQDFTLRCDGELHDGLGSLEEVERTFPMVAATLADWKADRLVPFGLVLEEARRLYLGTDPEADDCE